MNLIDSNKQQIIRPKRNIRLRTINKHEGIVNKFVNDCQLTKGGFTSTSKLYEHFSKFCESQKLNTPVQLLNFSLVSCLTYLVIN